jgi:signal transduction histidine kinase
VYRVVQESLTNCVRHARASRISVTVRAREDTLEVTVSDDGIGMDQSRRRAGFGLRGIEERVREIGGSVSLHSETGRGATLAIRLPLSTTEPALAHSAG